MYLDPWHSIYGAYAFGCFLTIKSPHALRASLARSFKPQEALGFLGGGIVPGIFVVAVGTLFVVRCFVY